MSIEVPIDQLFDDVARWDFCYLITVSVDGRPHLISLRPHVTGEDDARRLRLDAGGGRACHNATERSSVTLVFPPVEHSSGYSLVVDGTADVDGGSVVIRPSWAVLHRPAP